MGSLGFPSFAFWLKSVVSLFCLVLKELPLVPRSFGALLFSARNALIQMIRTSLFASVVVIGASLNHNRALTAKFSLIFPPSTIACNLFKLFVPLSPMKSRNRLCRRSWRIFFSLSPFLSLYLQQLLRTLFVFLFIKIGKVRQRFTTLPALCSDHIPRNGVNAQPV